MILTAIAIWLLLTNTPARDPTVAAHFRATHPCPLTGTIEKWCHGYVVDHKWPLCAGGLDTVENMQWQTVEEGKIKDRLEIQLCKCQREKK